MRAVSLESEYRDACGAKAVTGFGRVHSELRDECREWSIAAWRYARLRSLQDARIYQRIEAMLQRIPGKLRYSREQVIE